MTRAAGFVLSVLPGVLAAQQAPTGREATPASTPVASAARVTDAPRLDGHLNDAIWQAAPPITAFVQHEPFEGRPATGRTEVRILFDAAAVYVGAWLYDSDPEGIVLGETRRDVNLQNMNAFLIVFDTYIDRQNAFVFGTTPAGLEYDGQVTKEGQGGSGGSPGRWLGSSLRAGGCSPPRRTYSAWGAETT